jgi:thiamine-phosphate diphosphorylase
MPSIAPRLMLVTDRRLCPLDRLPALVDAVVAAGVDAVQLREKDLPPAELLKTAVELAAVLRNRAALYVNGNVDVARAAGADGVQLGEDAGTVEDARRSTDRDIRIGRSVHSVEGARTAECQGADLLILGTVFDSRSHPGGPTGGLRLVHDVTASVHVPVVGIGGITAANAGDVVAAGACGVAVISAILGAASPTAAAGALRRAVDAGRAALESRV